ncbi:uncharacterized protein DNG_02315 [Cephalotrichum gorgonifer]|uniref:Protein NO VEIN C-terminal domain-containing protein n=1 Tax=Cephalotrichum gorgonifer TaxID=2041049 RepID=A0AAE8MST3_9PEZI|nr:uncharacterized protein DNG_02315 [Cephalotrichum gorgonifer]
MATTEAAKEAVRGIAKLYGYVDDDVMEATGAWPPDMRRRFEESIMAKDRLAADSIKTLAENIYGSDARFVFELLQNAEDNQFRRAIKAGQSPFVSFQAHPNRIIVECNEDGFQENNLKAICAVGQSTKTTRHGYIGAKGIGFKSVFIAAWKVYIQSGHFSFAFKHKEGDSGLGMVTPVWQDTEEAISGPLTRMTLYLHEEGDPENIAHLRKTIFKQLDDLQETCLLFLKKLKEIRVEFYDESGAVERSKAFRVKDAGSHDKNLEATICVSGETTMVSRIYHVTRHTAIGIAKSDNRKNLTEADGEASSTAEIVLAFPLTATLEPLVKPQHLFAFLPVREGNFKFIIQSDFDTSANRQDIHTTSRRNVDLLDGIADADILGGFWAELMEKIKHRLSLSPVLMSRHTTALRMVKDVCILPANCEDENGDCLFDDRHADLMLSKAYPADAISTLIGYGLKAANYGIIFGLVRRDLNSDESRMKSLSSTAEWHSRVAALFNDCFEDSLGRAIPVLRSLPILPLWSGEWVSANSGPVYFPTTNTIPVPQAVDLRLLDPAAIVNAQRKVLFQHLGAKELSIPEVRASILRGYTDKRRLYDSDNSKAHLRYLYLTHTQSESRDPSLDKVYVYDHDESMRFPRLTDVYLHSNHPYGAEELFARSDDCPGLAVFFLHPSYLEDRPIRPNSTHPTWKKWLCDFIGVRELPRLASRDGGSISDGFSYIAEHRPEKLLGLLQHIWEAEGQDLQSHGNLIDKISRGVPTHRLCGNLEFPEAFDLFDAFLPFAHLQRQCSRFMGELEHFPFLNLPGDTTDEQLNGKWDFLHSVFGVKKHDDGFFLYNVHQSIQEFYLGGVVSVDTVRKVLDLYIEMNERGNMDPELNIDDYLPDFVLMPGFNEWQTEWVCTSYCRWEGPKEAYVARPLKHLYENVVHTPPDKMELLSQFFQQKLCIQNTSWEDVVGDLKSLKGRECMDSDRVMGLYQYIHDMKDTSFAEKLSGEFEDHSLVLAPSGRGYRWCKLSECLWSSTTQIKGTVALSDTYPGLEGLFVGTLGVRTLTLQIVYDDLLMTTTQMLVEDVKDKIWALNAFIQSDPSPPKPDNLLKAPVFPVKAPDCGVSLHSADAHFAIVDREKRAALFERKIKVLDYTLEEVWRLKPFLEWAGLQRRYLSSCIKEMTSVSDGVQRPISVLNRDLKRKAHAILRIAATFGSSRYIANGGGLCQLLRKAEVLETNGISSVLIISQDGQSIQVEEPLGDLHISETGSSLKIYVPMDKASQEFCFSSPLPEKMADWLMRDPETLICDDISSNAIRALAAVLSCELSIVGRVLEYRGIVQVQISNADVPMADNASEDVLSADGAMTPTSADVRIQESSTLSPLRRPTTESPVVVSDSVDSSTPSPVRQPRTKSPMVISDSVVQQTELAAAASLPRLQLAVFSSPREHLSLEDIRYGRILDRVVEAARSHTFPAQGAFSMAALFDALPRDDEAGYDGETVSRFRSSSQLERDKKIGAAGELFVFELLSALSLSGWSRANWPSTIRHYTTLHRDYEDMEPWHGRETADLTYDDTNGDLTEVLINAGYLEEDEWQDARPKYLLEVKSTTGPCETPFYVSKYQYQRMRSMHHSQREVYVIMRVFGIESGQIGVRVYIDPEQARVDGGLVFTGEAWSVVPGAGK